MGMLKDIRCKLGLHMWGPVQGDDWGGHQTCTYCAHTRRLRIDQPPDAHDHMGVHH